MDWLNWSDFVAALFGAVVGGILAIVASLWSTVILRRFEVVEQFGAKVGAVTGGIDYALRVLEGTVQDEEGPEKPIRNAAHYLGELHPYLAVVKIRNKKAQKDAEQTYVQLDQAVAALEKALEDPAERERARAGLEAAKQAFDDFAARARRLF
jgi:hypothetical protein